MTSAAPGGLRSTEFTRHAGSGDLLILCSGRLPGYRMPHAFTFSKLAGTVPVNKLFIRDNFGLWYHGGLEGLSSGIEDTALRLAEFIDRRGFAEVAIVGASAGGYAALLFGEMIGADAIHAIAPRTRLHPDAEGHADRDRHGVAESLAELQRRPGREERYFDLRRHFEENPLRPAQCRIYYDPEHGLDRFHAENLDGLPGIALEKHPGEGHEMAKRLCGRPGFFESMFGGAGRGYRNETV